MVWHLPSWLADVGGETPLSNAIRRVEAVVSGEVDRDDDSDPTRSTSLYSCPDCATTFISQEMHACSRCGEDVEQTPSERELGFVEN